MSKKQFFSQLSIAFTRFIPIIVFYSLLIVVDSFMKESIPFLTSFIHVTEILIVPILTVLIGYYIVGIKTLVPSILLGTYAGIMDTSFLGGLLTALLIVTFFNYLEKVYTSKSHLHHVVRIIIVTISTFVLFHFLILTPIEIILDSTNNMLENLQQGSVIVLVAVLAGLTAVDMGGPFNKLSFAFSLSVYLEGQYHISGPVLIAAGIPPLAIVLTVFLAPNYFNVDERKTKYRTLLLGIVGITEGALPYAVRRPLLFIPQFTVGAMLGSAFAAYFNLSNNVYITALPGVIGVNSITIFILSILVGVIMSFIFIIATCILKRQLSSSSENI